MIIGDVFQEESGLTPALKRFRAPALQATDAKKSEGKAGACSTLRSYTTTNPQSLIKGMYGVTSQATQSSAASGFHSFFLFKQR